MSKNISKLESLLLKADKLNEDTDKLVEENKESVLTENVLNDAIRDLITESLDEEDSDDDMDYDEADVDVDTGEEVDAAGEDDEEMDIDTSDEESPVGDEADVEAPVDVTAGMDDDATGMMGGEDEVMDMTNATEEEVLQVLKSLPDDAEVKIVKEPSFKVDVSQADEAPEAPQADFEPEFEMGDEEESQGSEDFDFDGESEDDEELNELDKALQEAISEMDGGNSMDEMIQEAINEMEKMNESNEEEMNEGENHPYEKGVKANVSKGGKDAPYDKAAKKQVKEVVAKDEKLNEAKLVRAYKKLVKENKKLRTIQESAFKKLEQTMAKVKELATMNSKLAYTTRLFTENSTTRKEKESILKKMDTAKTVSECKIIFNLLSENLEKRVTKSKAPNISKENLTEVKKYKNKQTIKEEQTFVKPENLDPENQKVVDFMFYESKS